jgi:hypothetical protein
MEEETKEQEEVGDDRTLFTLLLPADLKARLENYARENDMDMAQVVRKGIRKLINK